MTIQIVCQANEPPRGTSSMNAANTAAVRNNFGITGGGGTRRGTTRVTMRELLGR